jgi:gamma-butyrobetaine hydroxylase
MSTVAVAATRIALAREGTVLIVTWPDGRESPFPAVWLADNRPALRRTPLGQRRLDALELPETVRIERADLTAAGIALHFADIPGESVFDMAWLDAHALDDRSQARRRPPAPSLWDATLHAAPHAYDTVSADPAALAGWLGQVQGFGFARLSGVPVTPGTVLKVIELFGYVRETNYGKLFDVVSVETAQNLAFTNLGLGNHTDNPYRDPVPQLQLLHCLEAAAEGGESVVVDGFAAAERLRRSDPEAFHILTTTPVPFRYVEPGAVDLQHEAPLIALDLHGQVRAVCYNSRSIAPLDLDPAAIPGFYDAYRRFGRLLHDPALTVGFRLQPGDLFIVDNRRVLHGRRGFGAGRRHLQGAYADMDSLLSKLRILETTL